MRSTAPPPSQTALLEQRDEGWSAEVQEPTGGLADPAGQPHFGRRLEQPEHLLGEHGGRRNIASVRANALTKRSLVGSRS
jgi:hypothetical protein